MRPTFRTGLAGGVTVLVAVVWLVTLARVRTAGVAGDPWAVYYPVAQGLWRGDGVAAFAPLTRSGIRMPGFAVALALAAAATPNLVQAAQIVGILAAAATAGLVFWGARRLGGSLLAAVASALVVALHTEAARASLEALPDMLFVALFCATLAMALVLLASVDEASARRRALALGLLATAAFLTRPNGLALLAAVPVGLGVVITGPRRRLVLRRYGVGVGVGLVPWVALMLGLKLHGISYPQLSINASHAIEAASRSAGPVGGVFLAIWRGILDQPERVNSTVPWWLALLGLGAIVARSWRPAGPADAEGAGRVTAARLTLVVGLFMGGLLVPMHFEPRFYLFLAPLLVPAAALAVEGLARRAGRAGVAPVAALGLLVPALVVEIPVTRADNRREAGFGEEIRTVALALAGPGLGSGHLPVVGVSGAPRFLSSRTMPTPMRDGTRSALVVQGSPTDRGLDLWMSLPGEERPAGLGAPVAEPIGHSIFTAPVRVRSAASDASGRVVPLAFDLVLPQKRTCIDREMELGVSGRYRVVAAVEVPRDTAAHLGVSQGGREASTWTSQSGRVELGELDLDRGPSRLTLCASDHLLAGIIEWRTLELSAMGPPPTAAGGG
jgi:hypothetical protein